MSTLQTPSQNLFQPRPTATAFGATGAKDPSQVAHESGFTNEDKHRPTPLEGARVFAQLAITSKARAARRVE